jgi:heterodisulfide reductase subunit C
MNRFGFTITKGRLIDYDANDHSLAEIVMEQEPSLALCIACGCCGATCTAGGHTGFSLRRINLSLKRGENDTLRQEIARCMLCGKCTMLCPMGVNTRNIILTVRNTLKVLDGYAY